MLTDIMLKIFCTCIIQDDVKQEIPGGVLTRCVRGVPGHRRHQRHDPQAATRLSAGGDGVHDSKQATGKSLVYLHCWQPGGRQHNNRDEIRYRPSAQA